MHWHYLTHFVEMLLVAFSTFLSYYGMHLLYEKNPTYHLMFFQFTNMCMPSCGNVRAIPFEILRRVACSQTSGHSCKLICSQGVLNEFTTLNAGHITDPSQHIFSPKTYVFYLLVTPSPRLIFVLPTHFYYWFPHLLVSPLPLRISNEVALYIIM